MRHLFLVLLLSTGAPNASAQLSLSNNSFLLEEAWPADSAVNQHAVSYADRQWSYTWAQEFAAPDRPHRFGWSASLQSDGSTSKLGDLSLDYVWQGRGTHGDRFSVAPHVSFVTPLQGGDQRGAMIATYPLSVLHSARTATHWNVRGVWTAADEESIEISVAAGLVRLVGDRMAAVLESELRPFSREVTISAGARWRADRFARAGIVPGIAIPVTISAHDRSASLVFHVMFEHQLSRSED